MSLELQVYVTRPHQVQESQDIWEPGWVMWGDIEDGCLVTKQEVYDVGTLATNAGLRYGTYGNETSISKVFGDSTELAEWPLWYAGYRAPEYSTFEPFNGWTEPALWQFSDAGFWTPSGVINCDVSITPDNRVFLDVSNFTTLTQAQADYAKYRVSGFILGLQNPEIARHQKELLSD